MIMTFNKSLILGLFYIILSCGGVTDKSEKSISKISNESNNNINFVEAKPKFQNQKINEYEYKLNMQLDNVGILLRAKQDYIPYIDKLNTDTVQLVIEYPGQIANLQFLVFPKIQFDSIIVEQKFENALTLTTMEERFVHLQKRWYIDSAWQILQFDHKSRSFKINLYDHKEKENTFYHLHKNEFEEIKAEALSYKLDNYYKQIINNATALKMLPLDIWASKYIIKISIIMTDKKIEKYLIIKGSYGC